MWQDVSEEASAKPDEPWELENVPPIRRDEATRAASLIVGVYATADDRVTIALAGWMNDEEAIAGGAVVRALRPGVSARSTNRGEAPVLLPDGVPPDEPAAKPGQMAREAGKSRLSQWA